MKSQDQSTDEGIHARAVPRDQPDLRKLSRALIALALAQAQAEAEAEAEHRKHIEEDESNAA